MTQSPYTVISYEHSQTMHKTWLVKIKVIFSAQAISLCFISTSIFASRSKSSLQFMTHRAEGDEQNKGNRNPLLSIREAKFHWDRPSSTCQQLPSLGSGASKDISSPLHHTGGLKWKENGFGEASAVRAGKGTESKKQRLKTQRVPSQLWWAQLERKAKGGWEKRALPP